MPYTLLLQPPNLKHPVPYGPFEDEAEAAEWLDSFKAIHDLTPDHLETAGWWISDPLSMDTSPEFTANRYPEWMRSIQAAVGQAES